MLDLGGGARNAPAARLARFGSEFRAASAAILGAPRIAAIARQTSARMLQMSIGSWTAGGIGPLDTSNDSMWNSFVTLERVRRTRGLVCIIKTSFQ